MQKKQKILRLLFEFETEVLGIAPKISGNAFRHATHSQINSSFGVYSTLAPLTMPTSYQDFFTIREQKITPTIFEHRNLDKYSGKTRLIYFSRIPGITFDIINPPDKYEKYIRDRPLIQFGKGRNNGYGLVRLVDALLIELEDLEFPKTASHATLLSPLFYIPKYFVKYNCRMKYQAMWNHQKVKHVKTVPAGQFFRLQKGKSIKNIAKAGLIRKNLFGQFGFGEFIIRDWSTGGN